MQWREHRWNFMSDTWSISTKPWWHHSCMAAHIVKNYLSPFIAFYFKLCLCCHTCCYNNFVVAIVYGHFKGEMLHITPLIYDILTGSPPHISHHLSWTIYTESFSPSLPLCYTYCIHSYRNLTCLKFTNIHHMVYVCEIMHWWAKHTERIPP